MVVAELKTKVEKYETKASRCEQQARAATDKAEQSFYEVLAGFTAAWQRIFARSSRSASSRKAAAAIARPRSLDERQRNPGAVLELSQMSLTLIRATC